MVSGRQEADTHSFKLALVATPWHLCNRPSIQLGTLKAFLQNRAPWLRVNSLHPYLAVAREIGTATYQQIASNMWLSEALFATTLFPELKKKALGLARREAKKAGLKKKFDPLTVSAACGQALTNWLDSIDWSTYDLIGFSICCHQLLPSLFCAQRIKKRYPKAVIVFGGSSVLAGMQPILRQLASVDYCISGEGELPLLHLAERLSGGCFSESVMIKSSTNEKEEQLDGLSLPVPDYDDFFTEMKKVFLHAPFIPVIPIEFSRGCWWNKCTFCNLNLQWQGYRQKSASQLHLEITTLRRRYQCLDFTFTDNSLPKKASRLFFEKMRKEKGDTSFFAELRVQHTDDFSLFHAGGMTEAQVGIEALSTTLLAKMHKGSSVMDNIFAMKKAAELGLQLQGNLIVEFPGSTEQERDETLRTLDFVFPFTPLSSASFFLGHDSPVCRNPHQYGITCRTVHPKYRALFPPEVLQKLTLLVSGYRGDRTRQRRLWQPVIRKIESWQRFHQNRRGPARLLPLLFYRDGGFFLVIRQEEENGQILHHRLAGRSRDIYLACRQPVGLDTLCRLFPELGADKIRQFLDDLGRKKLVFAADDSYLALAVHRGEGEH